MLKQDIRFIDIASGKLYNGNQPYIHWFPDNCSTKLIYNIPICVASGFETINIEMQSPVFFLIDTDKLKKGNYEDINGFEYKNINDFKTNIYTSNGKKVDEYYLHMIYIGASAEIEAEYIDVFKLKSLDNTLSEEFSVGFRAYENNEINNINLSNFGISIPNAIQKSIYGTNVHEDLDDNILLNRKWKELLTNYWDVVANRGSYKSAINSLKWFEWGDLIKIREMWKYDEFDNISKTIYEDRELKSTLSEKYKNSLCRFAKSTYLALYVSMQELTGEYDNQKNPIIKDIVTKWSETDLMLKLSLLASFYETYFLPIHIDLIHATIEDIVYTDTFKLVTASLLNREDFQYDVDDIKSNIKDGDEFVLTNKDVQVGPSTVFGTQYNGELEYNDIKIVGVDNEVSDIKGKTDKETDNNLKTFWSQHFKDVAAMVPVKLSIDMNKYKGDFIKHGILCLSHDDEPWLQRITNKIFDADDKGYVHIDFNILCTKSGKYDMRLQFISAGGIVFATRIQFNVLDISNPCLKVYKIKRLSTELTEELINSNYINDYVMGITKTNDIIQYIPINPQKVGDGIALNNVLIFKQIYNDESELIDLDKEYQWIHDNYLINYKYSISQNGKLRYTICVSNTYWFDPSSRFNTLPVNVKQMIYRNEYMYFSELHKLEELTGNDIYSYMVTDNDTICVVPTIQINKDIIPFKYGRDIDQGESEWEFQNVSTGEIIKVPTSVRSPYITGNKQYLSNGYYNITFKYKLAGETKELKLNSAFVKI